MLLLSRFSWQGLAVRVRVLVAKSPLSSLPDFLGGVCWLRSPPYPAFPYVAVRCAVRFGFPLTHVCRGKFGLAGWFFFGRGVYRPCVGRVVPHWSWGHALSRVVVPPRPWWLSVPASLEGRCLLWWEVVGGPLWVLFPVFFFFLLPGLPAGGLSSVAGGGGFCWCALRHFRVVVHWPPLLPFPTAPPPPPSFWWLCSLAGGPRCVRVPVAGGLPFHRRASVSACPGWSFLWSVGCPVAVVVRLPWLVSVIGLGGVLSRCPSSGSRGRCLWPRLAGLLPALGEWLRGFALLWLSVLSSANPLVGGFVVVGRKGAFGLVRQFPVRTWPNFPPLPVFFQGGLPLPFSVLPGPVHARVRERHGRLAR